MKLAAAVDWITATTVSQSAGYGWLEMFNKYRLAREEQTKTFRMRGFIGLSAGSMRWGYRESDDRFMVIASAEAAEQTFGKIAPVASKVTRVDVRVDTWLKQAKPGLVSHSYRVPGAAEFDANRMAYALIKNNKGGQTLYCGSRQSLQFGRLYDKGAQQDLEPGKWFRYEVEFKGELAMKAAVRLVEKIKYARKAAEEWIRSLVHDWFASRWVIPVFDSAGTEDYLRPSATMSTPEKKLSWLMSQVRPTLAYLIDLGYREEMLAALGLENGQEPNAALELLERDVSLNIKERR